MNWQDMLTNPMLKSITDSIIIVNTLIKKSFKRRNMSRDAGRKERLRLVAKDRHESIAELAVSLGLQPKSLQVVMSDPNKLISISMVSACVEIGVNANWLLTGEGEHRIDAINDSRISELESRIIRSQDLVESLERMILQK